MIRILGIVDSHVCKARDFDLFVIKLLHSNCTFVLTPENKSFPRNGIYYKISSKRNRNVSLALKCMANEQFSALKLRQILRLSVRTKQCVEDGSDF